MYKCIDCGYPYHLHEHHVLGKKVDPNNVVYLCPNCHAREHAGMLLFHNRAAKAFKAWWSALLEQGVYVTWQARMDKLYELGYLPCFDHGQEAYLEMYEGDAPWNSLPMYSTVLPHLLKTGPNFPTL